MGNHEAEESLQTIGKATPFRLSRAPVTDGDPAHAAVLPDLPLPDYEDLGALPASYGEPVLYLVARDPEWFFAYWDLPAGVAEDTGLTLRVLFADHADHEERHLLAEVNLSREAKNWYLPIPEEATGHCFYGELGSLQREASGEEHWRVWARSGRTSVPARSFSGNDGSEFATVPFHLAFQKLLDMVAPGASTSAENTSNTSGSEEPLLTALARLQGEGRQLAAALGLVPDWNDEQRRLLAALLGHHPDDLLQRPTHEIDALLREGLSAHLSSGATSGPAAQSSEQARSYPVGPHGLSSESLLSWAQAAGLSSASVSSFSSEALFSWLSSWGQAIGAASSSSLSSWLSSWPGEESASRAEYWKGQLTSWDRAPGVSSATTSAGSSWMTSSGGSSWSGGSSGNFPARDFFLHVNAEVIFYGGTHPAAQVTINGEPVQLQADGSFRHHFRFPDGAGSVPIVARSPDGVEHRGAILRFDRGTARWPESRAVGHTAQPPEIPAPLWTRPTRKEAFSGKSG